MGNVIQFPTPEEPVTPEEFEAQLARTQASLDRLNAELDRVLAETERTADTVEKHRTGLWVALGALLGFSLG
jgi:hypothetical protein